MLFSRGIHGNEIERFQLSLKFFYSFLWLFLTLSQLRQRDFASRSYGTFTTRLRNSKIIYFSFISILSVFSSSQPSTLVASTLNFNASNIFLLIKLKNTQSSSRRRVVDEWNEILETQTRESRSSGRRLWIVVEWLCSRERKEETRRVVNNIEEGWKERRKMKIVIHSAFHANVNKLMKMETKVSLTTNKIQKKYRTIPRGRRVEMMMNDYGEMYICQQGRKLGNNQTHTNWLN